MKGPVDVRRNEEEVMDTRYVTHAELKAMMADNRHSWSPWFRKIEEKFLSQWWADLDTTLATDTFVDKHIHKV
jgi:isopentenyldiphosphate isomerase